MMLLRQFNNRVALSCNRHIFNTLQTSHSIGLDGTSITDATINQQQESEN